MPVFQVNCKALAGELKISQADAQQELLIELMEHRLNGWTDEKVIEGIKKQVPPVEMQWKIAFAKKDISRRKHHDDLVEHELTEQIVLSGPNEVEQIEPVQTDVARALDMAPSMFTNHQTQDWVQSLLTSGKRDTMVQFHQNDRQFSNKLRNVAAYCNSHRNRSVSYQRQEQAQQQAKELAILEGWNVLMADEDTDDTDIATWIALHRHYVEPLVDKSSIRFQGLVMNDFCRAPNIDKYHLANLLAYRYEQIQRTQINNE